MQKIFLSFLLTIVIISCNNATVPVSGSDALLINDTIPNYSGGARLVTVAVTIPSVNIVANGSISAAGKISLTLPGETTMLPFLIPVSTYAAQGTFTGTFSPTDANIAWVNATTQTVINSSTTEALVYGNAPSAFSFFTTPTALKFHVFIDRDAKINGSFILGGTNTTTINLSLKKGWNLISMQNLSLSIPGLFVSGNLTIETNAPDLKWRFLNNQNKTLPF
jgi:hypothetical protein